MSYLSLLFSFCFVLFLFIYFSRKFIYNKPSFNGNTLIVIAHPDDECMFFAPTILALSNRISQNVYVLCLSNGNYSGLGEKRGSEFFNSLQALGIPSENGILVNDPGLQDGPNNNWNHILILEKIVKTIQTFDILNLLTFDEYGVSGHINHCAIAKSILRDNVRLSNVNVHFLQSVNIIRKYLGILDILSILYMPKKSITFTTDLACLIKTHFAMYSHHSQYTWYRILYILYSRYVYINQFQQVAYKKDVS